MTTIIENFPLSPRIDLMLKYAGIPLKVQRKNPQRVKRARDRIRELREENGHLFYPKAIYQFFPSSIKGGQLLLDDKEVFTGSYLVKNMKKANLQETALFVVTIGDKIIEKIEEKEAIETIYLEAVASEVVEAAARYVCKVLAKEKGCKNSFRRLSPGWGEQKGLDWKLEEQTIIFKLLGRKIIKEKLGVELLEFPEMESYMMVPRKTVSAIAFHF